MAAAGSRQATRPADRPGRALMVAPLACAIAASVLSLVACGGDTPAASPGSVGTAAPAYESRTLDGAPASLAALKGKVVLLNVWATWCHPCRDEIPELEALHQRFRARGLEVIGVSVDAAGMEAGIRSFMTDFRMTYPVWLDPDERVSAQFLTTGVPETFLIDRAGVIRWRKIGPVQLGDTLLAAAVERALGG
jgi:peroxiredoxin